MGLHLWGPVGCGYVSFGGVCERDEFVGFSGRKFDELVGVAVVFVFYSPSFIFSIGFIWMKTTILMGLRWVKLFFAGKHSSQIVAGIMIGLRSLFCKDGNLFQ